jgi:hypothetical protein
VSNQHLSYFANRQLSWMEVLAVLFELDDIGGYRWLGKLYRFVSGALPEFIDFFARRPRLGLFITRPHRFSDRVQSHDGRAIQNTSRNVEA